MNLVERINTKCKENGISIKALERELGFGNGNIRRWDTQKPSYDKIISVAEKLHVSVNWLIFEKETPELTPEEQKLIEYYRSADEKSKTMIMALAAAGAVQNNNELENSSTSKIG